MQPKEAELAKLFTNAWRYIQFATVEPVLHDRRPSPASTSTASSRRCTPRLSAMAGMPGPGFAAGPCLFKDTMQLAAFSHEQLLLGHAAMLINEGLPALVVRQLASETPPRGQDASASWAWRSRPRATTPATQPLVQAAKDA